MKINILTMLQWWSVILRQTIDMYMVNSPKTTEQKISSKKMLKWHWTVETPKWRTRKAHCGFVKSSLSLSKNLLTILEKNWPCWCYDFYLWEMQAHSNKSGLSKCCLQDIRNSVPAAAHEGKLIKAYSWDVAKMWHLWVNNLCLKLMIFYEHKDHVFIFLDLD